MNLESFARDYDKEQMTSIYLHPIYGEVPCEVLVEQGGEYLIRFFDAERMVQVWVDSGAVRWYN